MGHPRPDVISGQGPCHQQWPTAAYEPSHCHSSFLFGDVVQGFRDQPGVTRIRLITHVAGQAVDQVVLAAIGFIGNHDDVPCGCSSRYSGRRNAR
jgi:hypothetical protein